MLGCSLGFVGLLCLSLMFVGWFGVYVYVVCVLGLCWTCVWSFELLVVGFVVVGFGVLVCVGV